MAKKKNTPTFKKISALVVSLWTFIVLSFFDMIFFITKSDYSSDKYSKVKVVDFLFKEDYGILRETFEIANIVMLASFALVVFSVILTILALFIKKGTVLSKMGTIVLCVAMLLLFFINLDKTGGTIVAYFSNITALYFQILVICVIEFFVQLN